MCVAVIKLALRIAFAIVLEPFRIFSATVLQASCKVLYLTWGRNQIDTAPAQRVLSAKGIPTLPITYPTRGGGGYGVRGGRFITEMTGNGGWALTTGGKYTLHASGGSGFLNMGYLVKRGSYFRAYPLIGFGGGGTGARVTGGADAAINGGNDSGKVMMAGSPLVNLGLGLEFKLGSRFGVMAGIRFGFVFSPFRAGGVTVLIPYARFIGGVGTFRGRRKGLKG